MPATYDPSAGKTYPHILPADIARVEIFPPVGIARVGDSGCNTGSTGGIEYFYGPEVPGIDGHPFGAFRDESDGIKRQVGGDCSVLHRPWGRLTTLVHRPPASVSTRTARITSFWARLTTPRDMG